MSENGWSKSDKKVAHAALDKAWAAEFAETKLKIIKQAADMRYTDDMEQLEHAMRDIRKNWRTVYSHSFTFMDSKLARHYCLGYLTDEDLAAFSERKQQILRDEIEWIKKWDKRRADEQEKKDNE